jgi:hypothetical protein
VSFLFRPLRLAQRGTDVPVEAAVMENLCEDRPTSSLSQPISSGTVSQSAQSLMGCGGEDHQKL